MEKAERNQLITQVAEMLSREQNREQIIRTLDSFDIEISGRLNSKKELVFEALEDISDKKLTDLAASIGIELPEIEDDTPASATKANSTRPNK